MEFLNRILDGKTTSQRRYTVVLQPGDLMYVRYILACCVNLFFSIQPPNLVHRVYAAEACIGVGGHFYTYNAIHHSEAAERLDVLGGFKYPNEKHTAVQRLLFRMAISLGALGSSDSGRGGHRHSAGFAFVIFLQFCQNDP